MHIKKIITLFVIMLITPSIVFARTHTSPNYSLLYLKIVVSGGKSDSFNYTLDNVEIGNSFGGKAESSTYSLNAGRLGRTIFRPHPPTRNPIISPTNMPTQLISGTKDQGTSIYVNGYERVSLNNKTDWSADVSLSEGMNVFAVTARNKAGIESESVSAMIILDTVPPALMVTAPLDYSIVTTNVIDISGTVDDRPLSEQRYLMPGKNTVTVEFSDEAGNTSGENRLIYRARNPIAPPR